MKMQEYNLCISSLKSIQIKKPTINSKPKKKNQRLGQTNNFKIGQKCSLIFPKFDVRPPKEKMFQSKRKNLLACCSSNSLILHQLQHVVTMFNRPSMRQLLHNKKQKQHNVKDTQVVVDLGGGDGVRGVGERKKKIELHMSNIQWTNI